MNADVIIVGSTDLLPNGTIGVCAAPDCVADGPPASTGAVSSPVQKSKVTPV